MSGPDEKRLPLAAETVEVTRRRVPTGRVRVRVAPAVHEEALEIALHDRSVTVAHVPVGRFVDSPPPVRTEGDCTVIPLLEERAVVTLRLFLREELHVRTQTHRRVEQRRVALRSDQAEVQRLAANRGESNE